MADPITVTIEVECRFCGESDVRDVEVPTEQFVEGFDCGAELDSGGTCSRSVDSPDDTCWDH